jgi:transcriptional regulator with XRE-family HTH domain
MNTTQAPVGTEADMREISVLGRRLKELREAAGLSQQALAVAAGLSTSVVSQVEQGQRQDPRISTVAALAEALGVEVGELLKPPRRKRGKED